MINHICIPILSKWGKEKGPPLLEQAENSISNWFLDLFVFFKICFYLIHFSASTERWGTKLQIMTVQVGMHYLPVWYPWIWESTIASPPRKAHLFPYYRDWKIFWGLKTAFPFFRLRKCLSTVQSFLFCTSFSELSNRSSHKLMPVSSFCCLSPQLLFASIFGWRLLPIVSLRRSAWKIIGCSSEEKTLPYLRTAFS